MTAANCTCCLTRGQRCGLAALAYNNQEEEKRHRVNIKLFIDGESDYRGARQVSRASMQSRMGRLAATAAPSSTLPPPDAVAGSAAHHTVVPAPMPAAVS